MERTLILAVMVLAVLVSGCQNQAEVQEQVQEQQVIEIVQPGIVDLKGTWIGPATQVDAECVYTGTGRITFTGGGQSSASYDLSIKQGECENSRSSTFYIYESIDKGTVSFLSTEEEFYGTAQVKDGRLVGSWNEDIEGSNVSTKFEMEKRDFE